MSVMNHFASYYAIMKYHDKNGWKNKIDPAFDKPIKTYINYLRQIENLPNDGQICFQDDFAELINKNPDFSASYKHEFKKEMLRFTKNILISFDSVGIGHILVTIWLQFLLNKNMLK